MEKLKEYMDNLMNEDDIVHVNHINDKVEHAIFEAALEAFQGEDVFDKINARIDQIDK